MAVIGAELTVYADISSLIIRIYINQPLRDHKRNDIETLAEPLYLHVHHIKSFPKDLMAVGKITDDFSHHCYLIVFNYLICHFLFSLLTH